MKEIGYPKLEEQMRAHEAFIDKLVHIDVNELDAIDLFDSDLIIICKCKHNLLSFICYVVCLNVTI